MIPFQKIFTLLIRTFSRPMLNHFKNQQKLKEHSLLGRLFVAMGRRAFALQHWINIRMLKTLTPKKHVVYKPQVLLEKGVQTFYEVLFYMIVLGLPFWQLYKGSLSSIEKQKKLQSRISGLDQKLTNVNKRIDQLQQIILSTTGKSKRENTVRKPVAKNNSATTRSDQEATADQKLELQQIIEHAVEVVADQFEDVLDQISLSADSQITANEQIVDSDDLLSFSSQVEVDSEVSPTQTLDQFEVEGISLQDVGVQIDNTVDISVDVDVGDVDVPAAE